MKKYFIYIFLLSAVALMCSLASCEKEERFDAELSALQFSCDTMAFDTVFTHMGTTTRQFKVYNRGEAAVRLAAVALEGGRASRFRLNVDGDTSMTARDVDIAAGDSIFVFVRANIRPNDASEPFLIEDAVLFSTESGQQRRLPLTAYGRNAVYHVPTDTLRTEQPDAFGNPYAYSIIDCENWRHDLPHVILGYAVVDSRQTLHLTAGDELYFHNDAVLWIFDSASLDVQGTEEQPVLFTSVRHDGWYDYLPGQWGYIWCSQGSVNNRIDHAVIENGFIGVMIDSCANTNPTLAISNTEIRNHTRCGIMGKTAYIEGGNLLITNCGDALMALQYGGRYDFSGCTLANYWRYGTRKYAGLMITNTYDYEAERIHYVWPMQAHFSDCIVYGNRYDGELYVGLDSIVPVSATFAHCLIRGGEWDEDPLFVDPSEGDYHLQEDSPAWGIGYQFPQVATEDSTRSRSCRILPRGVGFDCSRRLLPRIEAPGTKLRLR